MRFPDHTLCFLLPGMICLLVLAQDISSQPPLSNLSATKSDPLFTTYAAPLQRSEFKIDEGYHLKFYDENAGIDFLTDHAGFLSLAFKRDGNIRYRVSQMFREPVITRSYSDLVQYHYQPYKGILVEIFFVVYNSRIAIQEITITNIRTQPVQLNVYPFLQHPLELKEVSISPDSRYFRFIHNEPPDNWTLAHAIPHEDELMNIYLLSEPPDAFGAYRLSGSLPQPLKKSRQAEENYCLEWGAVYHEDGTPCYHTPPTAQQVLLHNGSLQEILTEEAPLWDDSLPNIPGDGTQRCELGNFRNPPPAVNDSFTVIFTCFATGQQGISRGIIPALPAPSGIRTDIQLSSDPFPPRPQNVAVQFSLNFTSAVITWNRVPGYLYHLYRRVGNPAGRYHLIADSLESSGFLDTGLNPDSSYHYIVIATDSLGRIGPHSSEVGNGGTVPFFEDMSHSLLSNQINSALTRIVAFQKILQLDPGESAHLRIIRGVTERNGNLDDLVATCQDLLSYNLQQALKADEVLYSRIPQIRFPNPDYLLMYWSAFSMMRQCFLPPEGSSSYNYNVYSREPTWGWGHAGQVFHENLSMLAYVFMDPASAQESQWVFAERMNTQPQWPRGYIPYRVGPYLNEVNFWANEYTSSAPWFNWENWEIFNVSKDTAFLEQIYDYGQQFYDFWIANRDDDGDGLCEWGAHAFWESVRDYNVIWHVLGGWADPHNANKVEALDLNCELVMEAKALAQMANTLGRPQEVQLWLQRAQRRADSINASMWDPETHFYYHVEKQTHTFTYQTLNDLKHKEHIGFLPLWAGIAIEEQVNYLIQELHNPATFGRPYGTPLQAHDDPLDPGNGFFTHSVYPEWDFLIFKGLLNYGLIQEAEFVAHRLWEAIIQTLKDHHDFYESYYCDEPRPSNSWLHTYIWTGVVARMLIDLYGPTTGFQTRSPQRPSQEFQLYQNFPNPFNSTTQIVFNLPRSQFVTLTVFDITGRRIFNLIQKRLNSGIHSVQFKVDGLSSGLYFYRLKAGRFIQVKKMLYLK